MTPQLPKGSCPLEATALQLPLECRPLTGQCPARPVTVLRVGSAPDCLQGVNSTSHTHLTHTASISPTDAISRRYAHARAQKCQPRGNGSNTGKPRAGEARRRTRQEGPRQPEKRTIFSIDPHTLSQLSLPSPLSLCLSDPALPFICHLRVSFPEVIISPLLRLSLERRQPTSLNPDSRQCSRCTGFIQSDRHAITDASTALV